MRNVCSVLIVLALTAVSYGQSQAEAQAAKDEAIASQASALAIQTVADAAVTATLMKSSEAYMKYFNVWRPVHGKDLAIEAQLATASAATTLALTPYNNGKSAYTSAVGQMTMGNMAMMYGQYPAAFLQFASADASFTASITLFGDGAGRACEATAEWQEALDMMAP